MPDIEILAPVAADWEAILTPDALNFVGQLAQRFEAERLRLLARRREVQARLDAGELPDFLPETADLRADRSWHGPSIPPDLTDRRVEITGPVDRKMIINALNSGANVFMADFEDANSPTWENVVQGQLNLRDAVNRTIEFTNEKGKTYRLNQETATLMVRPRGWHLDEQHVLVDGRPVSGSLFDFGLYFFHNARVLLDRGTGPYFYLPKMESHLEARLWNEVFRFAQETLGLPVGTIRATVLIETILATFEAEEIIYELREHSAGLNCGRWDYIFSVIKKFRARPEFLFPDRGLVTMTRHFLKTYTEYVIKVCHRRGVHAMGGMSAFIPVKGDPAANERALAQVAADKEREASAGHDGTWVAHPALVPVAREVFDRLMPTPNQISRQRDDVQVSAADLLQVPEGPITEAGMRQNITVGIRYLAAWLGGQGAVPIFNLMEDAATCEISRSQLWQWIHHGGKLDDGRAVTAELYRSMQAEELAALRDEVGEAAWDGGHYRAAAQLLDSMIVNPAFTEFMTIPAYQALLAEERAGSPVR
ncbi:MAG TPA: malate synthase A [Gemmatimonadales bacterium]|nr:malate synthase A [Gemmatimonadales bacterium]